MPPHAVASHYGVGHKRVRAVYAAHQHGGVAAHAQQPVRHSATGGEGQQERQRTEAQPLPAVVFHRPHVQLQGGHEHDVVHAHLPEYLEAAVSLYDVEPVLPYDYAQQYQPHDVGYAQESQQRGGEYYDEDERERPRGVGNESPARAK